MKLLCKLSIGTLAFLVSVVTFSAKAQSSYTIDGALSSPFFRNQPNLKMQKIYLSKYVNEQIIPIDSAEIKNGKFHFEGTAPNIVDRYLLSGFDNGAIPFFLEPGHITIAPFDAAYPGSAIVTGTPNNDVFRELTNTREVVLESSRKRMSTLENEIPEHLRSDAKVSQEYSRSIFFQNTLQFVSQALQFCLKYPDKVASLYVMDSQLGRYFSSEAFEKALLVAVSPTLYNHPKYQEMLNKYRGKNLKPGAPVPDIIGRDLQGNTVALANFKGKYVLLDFWASWCAPCRREIPHLKKALQVISESPMANQFVVLSFSIDTKENSWKGAIEQNQMDIPGWVHISDLAGGNSDMAMRYGVTSVPQTFLINPDGLLVQKNLRGEELVQKIKNIAEGKVKYN